MNTISPRVARLRDRLEAESARCASGDWGRARFLYDQGERSAYLALFPEAFRQIGPGDPLRFRARLLSLFAARMPVASEPDALIHGSMRFLGGNPWCDLPEADRAFLGEYGGTTQLHVAVDYPRMASVGPAALRADVEAMPAGALRDAMLESIDAFRAFIRRHDGCADLADRPARTLREALQMVWFTHIFIHAESGGWWGVSFGLMDRFLLPYLSADDHEGDFDAVCAFLMKCCEGEESQNVTLGGSAADADALTIMFLDAMRLLKLPQPALSLRIGASTSETVWNAALALAMEGFGMPAFFNSPVMQAGLRRIGVPPAKTADWAVIGCYEATVPGETKALTTAAQVALPQALVDYMQSAPDAPDFDSFIAGFRAFARDWYLQKLLPSFDALKKSFAIHEKVPFESLCLRGCIERNRDSTDMGPNFNFFGVNMLGIGTLVDSLLAIRELVYGGRDPVPLRALAEQVAADFPDESIRRRCLAIAGRFGTDSEPGNSLASALSEFFADMVIAHPLSDGSRPYPAFFWFGGDIHHPQFATPDGRHAADRFSYGCGAADGTACAPTALLNSAARVAQDHAPCGSPITLSMGRRDASPQRIRELVEGYFARGGSHVHVNIVSTDEMRAAQRDPDAHASLLVRISGYSARFVTIDREWQDAIIARTEMGR